MRGLGEEQQYIRGQSKRGEASPTTASIANKKKIKTTVSRKDEDYNFKKAATSNETMTASLINIALLLIISVSLANGLDQFNLDMTNSTHTCPANWVEWSVQGRRLCARPQGTSGCVSATFTPQQPYSVIVGDVRAYQYGIPDGFT